MSEYMVSFLEHRLCWAYLRIPDLVILLLSLRICISNMFSDDADAAHPGAAL